MKPLAHSSKYIGHINIKGRFWVIQVSSSKNLEKFWVVYPLIVLSPPALLSSADHKNAKCETKRIAKIFNITKNLTSDNRKTCCI